MRAKKQVDAAPDVTEEDFGHKTKMTPDKVETPTDLYDACINALSHGAFHLHATLRSHANINTSRCSPGHRCLHQRMGGDSSSIKQWTKELVETLYVSYQDFFCKGTNKRVHHRTYTVLDGQGKPFFETLRRLQGEQRGSKFSPGKSKRKKKGKKHGFTGKSGAKDFYPGKSVKVASESTRIRPVFSSTSEYVKEHLLSTLPSDTKCASPMAPSVGPSAASSSLRAPPTTTPGSLAADPSESVQAKRQRLVSEIKLENPESIKKCKEYLQTTWSIRPLPTIPILGAKENEPQEIGILERLDEILADEPSGFRDSSFISLKARLLRWARNEPEPEDE